MILQISLDYRSLPISSFDMTVTQIRAFYEGLRSSLMVNPDG